MLLILSCELLKQVLVAGVQLIELVCNLLVRVNVECQELGFMESVLDEVLL